MTAFQCQKATFFVLNKRLHKEFFKDFEDADPSVIKGREKYLNYIHGVMYDDTQETEDRKLMAIARVKAQVPEVLIFPSIIGIEKEMVREQEKMAVCVRVHKAGGDIQGIVQIEYSNTVNKDEEDGDEKTNSPRAGKLVKASKNKEDKQNQQATQLKNFSFSDEYTLGFMVQFLTLRLEKFVLNRDIRAKI
jgi:hypothetical protein